MDGLREMVFGILYVVAFEGAAAIGDGKKRPDHCVKAVKKRPLCR